MDKMNGILRNSEYSYLLEFFNNKKLNIVTKSANFNKAVEEI